MLHYIIKRGKKEVRAFYLNPMSFSLFLFDFSSANLFEQLHWINDFFKKFCFDHRIYVKPSEFMTSDLNIPIYVQFLLLNRYSRHRNVDDIDTISS